eukprot:COSAG06_NODE_18019_length_908_cov_1.211372_1_plen_73_part_00
MAAVAVAAASASTPHALGNVHTKMNLFVAKGHSLFIIHQTCNVRLISTPPPTTSPLFDSTKHFTRKSRQRLG